ncbi:MAG: hypothetical protein KDK70_10880 [Myxococcales bacterium]|nr:hypothetical protein [Myxococcales bacterium]
MRCRAYQLPSEVYREIETQILQQLREGDRDQLRYLLADHDLEVELLSGEWRVLFEALPDYYQEVDHAHRVARMAVSPDELAEFVAVLRDPARQEAWRSISFGLAELTDALPADCDLVGVVFTEESDDWLWAEPVSELVAIRPEVFALLEPHLRALMEAGDFAALARLAEDHCEGCVEFSPHQWSELMKQSAERVPELLPVYQQRLSGPEDYTSILEALGHVADPRFQPSLDAWLRVHSGTAQYALYFRDAKLERREIEGSGLIRLSELGIEDAVTQRLPKVSGGVQQAPLARPPRAGKPSGDPEG